MSETQTPVSEDFMRDFIDLKRKVADISNTGVGKQFTTGDLIPAIGTTRAGALLCDGATYTRATYPALSAVCITIPALIGDGSTTFTVPDYRGQALAGADGSTFTLGAATGVTAVTLTAAQSGQPAIAGGTSGSTTPGSVTSGAGSAHSHGYGGSGTVLTTYNGVNQDHIFQNTAGSTWATNGGTTTNSEAAHTHSVAGSAHTHTTPAVAAAPAAASHTNVQPTLACNVFIVT